MILAEEKRVIMKWEYCFSKFSDKRDWVTNELNKLGNDGLGSGSSHGRRSPIDEAPKIMNLQVDKVAQAGFTGVMQLRDHAANS